jgi:hypothetical protein
MTIEQCARELANLLKSGKLPPPHQVARSGYGGRQPYTAWRRTGIAGPRIGRMLNS